MFPIEAAEFSAVTADSWAKTVADAGELTEPAGEELFLSFLLFLVPFLPFVPFLSFFPHRLFGLALSSMFDADDDEAINDDEVDRGDDADDDGEILRARRRRGFRCDFGS